MDIPLTPQQLQALDAPGGDAPRLVDPRNNAAYVLVRETDYEAVRNVIEEEERQRMIGTIAMRNAIGRAGEDVIHGR